MVAPGFGANRPLRRPSGPDSLPSGSVEPCRRWSGAAGWAILVGRCAGCPLGCRPSGTGPTCVPRRAECAGRETCQKRLRLEVVYAIVRAGGRQEKVEVGTVVTLDRMAAGDDGTVTLSPVLL